MPLSFDPRAFMAPGGVVSGLDDLGSAVVTALNRRAERKYQTEAERRAAAASAAAAERRRAQEIEDRDLGIKTKREEADLAHQRASEKEFNEAFRRETSEIKEREFKAKESELDRQHREKLAATKATGGAARMKALSAVTKLPPEEIEAARLAVGLTADGKYKVPGVGGMDSYETNPPPEIAAKFDAELAARRKRRGLGDTHDSAAVQRVLDMPDDDAAPASAAAAAPGASDDPVVGGVKTQLMQILNDSITASAAKPGDPNKRSAAVERLRTEIASLKTNADVQAFYQRHPELGTPEAMPDPNAPPAPAAGPEQAAASPIPLPEELARSGFSPTGQPLAPQQANPTADQFNKWLAPGNQTQPRPAAVVSQPTNEQFVNGYLNLPEDRIPVPPVPGPIETPFEAPAAMPLPEIDLGRPEDPPQSMYEALTRGAETRQRREMEARAMALARQMAGGGAAPAPAGIPDPGQLQFRSAGELQAYMQWLAQSGLPFGTPPPPAGLPGTGMPVPPASF